MASIDLLEALKVNDYYPQKLSYSEAIKLRGRSQNGCQYQYGLEIVRKLLISDFKAMATVANEINERVNTTDKRETGTKTQRVSTNVRPSQRGNVRPPRARDGGQQNQRQLHPIDLLVVIMNCSDNFLRQVLVEKLVANKLSIPILLPGVRNGSHTLLIFALKSLFPEVPDPTLKVSAISLTDTLVDIKNPIVSFIRVGNLHRSKSKVVNDLLGFSAFNTFFHRECPNGSAKRSVSNGSIEATWFQSETATKEELNCRFLTALNLRGDARYYPKQTLFLCTSSTLVVFMVDSFESFKELHKDVLKDAEVSQTKIVVCYVSTVCPSNVNETYFAFLEDLIDSDVISEVKYDWEENENMSDTDFTNELRRTISKLSRPKHGY